MTVVFMRASAVAEEGEARVPRARPVDRRRRPWLLPALGFALVATAALCTTIGSYPLTLGELGALMLGKLGVSTSTPTLPGQDAVLFSIRLPRIVLGMLVGASLGMCGAAMQGVFRNALVDPGLLGVANGAALAACASIVLGKHAASSISPVVSSHFLPVAAFCGALVATGAVDRLARFGGRTAVATLLLAGIGINALTGSLTGMLIAVANDAELRTITFWMLGSLSGARWQTVLLVLPCVALGIVLLPRAARPLNALLLGETDAQHIGFNVERVKQLILVLVALAVGACVAVSGVLGFVGLVVPHLLRLVCGPEHRILLPGSALLGAILLLLADALARTLVAPAELPLGVVTGALGTPFFLALLVRERRRIA